MVNIARRTVLASAGAALALPAIGGRARAAEFTLTYGNDASVGHPVNIQATEVARRIAADTGGRVVMRVFPNSQLGSDTDMLSQLRLGGIDMMTVSGLILAILVPAASVNGIGFAFPDYGAVWRAMDGELGAHVRGEIARSGLNVMDRMWDNGFRQITASTRPIRTREDLSGFRIRVPVSPLWTSMFKALGAAPTGINFAETYSALQTHIVDGQEQPLVVIETSKIYEVQRYCSLTNHMWDGYWWLVNRRSWEARPPGLRDVVAAHINEGALRERTDIVQSSARAKAALQGEGLRFNTVDSTAFVAALRDTGFYAEWRHRYGDRVWSLLEAVSGRLA